MSADDQTGNWGISHLTSMPVTLTFGAVLIGVLVLLILLRVLFGGIKAGGE